MCLSYLAIGHIRTHCAHAGATLLIEEEKNELYNTNGPFFNPALWNWLIFAQTNKISLISIQYYVLMKLARSLWHGCEYGPYVDMRWHRHMAGQLMPMPTKFGCPKRTTQKFLQSGNILCAERRRECTRNKAGKKSNNKRQRQQSEKVKAIEKATNGKLLLLPSHSYTHTITLAIPFASDPPRVIPPTPRPTHARILRLHLAGEQLLKVRSSRGKKW